MRVLHFVDCDSLSWLAPWIAHMRSLDRLGIEQMMLCRGGEVARAVSDAGFRAESWRPLASWAPVLSPGFVDVVRRMAPDIVHTRLSSAAGIAGYWRRRLGLPVVSTIDKPARGKYYRRADRCAACSRWVRGIMVEREGLDGDLVEVIYDPIDIGSYERDEAKGRALRTSLGIRDDETVISGLGVFVRRKAFDVLIRAAAELIRSGREGLRVLLIGGGGEAGMRASYIKLASELGIGGALLMPDGFVEDVRPWLWASDVFAMPSREEGLGIALLEARAASLPSVVSDIGPFLELTSDGIDGLVAPADDAPAFARAIATLLDMGADARSSMIRAALDRLSRDISLESVADQTAAFYERALGA